MIDISSLVSNDPSQGDNGGHNDTRLTMTPPKYSISKQLEADFLKKLVDAGYGDLDELKEDHQICCEQ